MSKEYTTKKREAIFTHLQNHKEQGFSASELLAYLDTIEVKMNKTTVYRYLDKLAEQNQLRKFPSEDGKSTLYQYVEKHHDCGNHLHIRCVQCGKVTHLDCSFITGISEHLRDDHGYELLFDKSTLCGICDSCREKGRDSQ